MTTYVEYSANTSKYESAMSHMEAISQKTLNFVKDNWLGLGTAIGLAYKVLGEFNQALDTADQLNKLAKSTGIATEELSAYKYMAEMSGVSIEETAKGINLLSRHMVEAAGGSKEAQKAFDLMGISVREADGQMRTANAVLAEVADRFSRMPDGATKATLAMEIFGKSGASLIPLLNEGAEGMAKMKEEAERLGLIVSGDTARAAEGLNDNLARLNKMISGSANILLQAYVPALEAATRAMTDFLGITGESGARKHMENQKSAFERQLSQMEAIAAAPGTMDKYLSWIPGFTTREQAEQAAKELRARIGLINRTIESMKTEAEAKTGVKEPFNPTIPENWGEEPKSNKELERLQQQAELEMAKAQETLTMKSDMEKFMQKDLDEALYEMRQTRLERETGFSQKNIELRQWEHDAALQIAQTQSEEEERLAKKREEMVSRTTTNMLENWAYFFQYFGQKNKAAFAAFKAISIAQTIIDTYKAAQGAYSAMVSIPYVGPAMAPAAAAAAIAAGMARVAAISSTEPGGGAAGGAGGGGGAIGTYSASPTTGLPTGYPAGGGEQRGGVTIYIQGDSINDEEYLERWAEKISKMVEDRDVRLVSSTSKFAEALA